VIAETAAGPVLWGLVGGVLPGPGGCSARVVIIRLGEARAAIRQMTVP
jgi:hypothetical protein